MSDTRTHAGPTSAGSILGSYRILNELTSGGMGTVYRAEHVLLGRPAAIKLLRRDLSTSPALVQRFVNEARAVTACKHPGIVEVYDFGYTDDGHAFIVMELLDGESLGRRLARCQLTELEAAAIAHGIASALKAAHRVGVIHRDLKPDNVFLVPDPDGGVDRTKVLDFGIAKLADGSPGRNTETGSLIGTPLYMAPEQARAAAAIDHRADLYSLGCILYHMLTGRPPFVADGAGEIIALQMFGEVVPPSRLAPVTPEMERVVVRLLDKEPERRFATAGEVVHALTRLDHRPTRRMTRPPDDAIPDAAATRPGGVASRPGEHPASTAPVASAEPAPTTAPERRRSALPLIAGALGVLALAAAGIAYATRGDPPAGAPPGPASIQPVAAPQPPPAPTVPASAPPPAPTEPPAPPAVAAPVASEAPGPAPERHAPPPARVHPAHRTGSGVGSITPSGGRVLPERTIEVHRDSRGVGHPAPGEHTPDGAPMEDTVDLKPTRGRAPRAPSPSSPKDASSP